MKINEDFISHEVDGEYMLIPTGANNFSGLVKGNATMGAIIEIMREDVTEEQIIEKMLEKFDAPREVIARDVRTVIEKLSSIGAIDGAVQQ